VPNHITAKTILDLLMAKHEKDVCVPECKTGGSWTNSHMQKMDLWTMTRSWAKPKVTVYEIKVSRNDFLQDDKWHGYLPFGNEFYFVSPPSLIDKTELPPEAGLMVTSKNGTRLYTKKKAPFRDVTIPESVWRYLLMWRSRIDVDMERQTRLQYWQKFLENRQYTSELGFQVSKGLREMIKTEIAQVRHENNALKLENKGLQAVKNFLTSNGISERMIAGGQTLSFDRRRLDQIIRQAGSGIPEGLPGAVSNAIQCLKAFREMIDGCKHY
jgi:hypothetical protein